MSQQTPHVRSSVFPGFECCGSASLVTVIQVECGSWQGQALLGLKYSFALVLILRLQRCWSLANPACSTIVYNIVYLGCSDDRLIPRPPETFDFGLNESWRRRWTSARSGSSRPRPLIPLMGCSCSCTSFVLREGTADVVPLGRWFALPLCILVLSPGLHRPLQAKTDRKKP